MHIVSVTRSVPYPGIPHAGGEYYLRHVDALRALGHRVTVVAPRTAENEIGARLAPDGVLLYGDTAASPSGLDRLVLRVDPARVPWRERRALIRDAAVRAAVAEADVVEYQWTQAATLHRLIPRAAPRRRARPAFRMVVLHDVMTQQVRRQRDDRAAPRGLRAQRALKLAAVRRTERRAIRGADVVVVFSQKDAAHVRELAPRDASAVRVVRPPLAQSASTSPRIARERNGFVVVMVGWFRRSDNADAALWLCREVWPRVIGRIPEARLVLAGADPTDAMREAARRDASIRVTGYLESLDEEYRAADVVAVPLFQGAGVKFKTVVAMLWGLPVVSTAVGLEGITEDPRRVWREAEDAEGFADGLIAAWEAPDEAARVAENARRWAAEEFSEERFRDALSALLPSHGARHQPGPHQPAPPHPAPPHPAPRDPAPPAAAARPSTATTP